MENNELTDDELFILLKGMIRQKETDKALKLLDMLYKRLNVSIIENCDLRDVLELAENLNYEDYIKLSEVQ